MNVAAFMKAAIYGRIVFGVSAAVLGVAGLISHDSGPFDRIAAVAEIAAGIALLLPHAARPSSIILGIVFALLSLTTVPGMIAAPRDAVQYVDFFEQLSIAAGALAIYAGTEPEGERAAMLGKVARLALAVCALSYAWAQVVYLQYTASLVPAWIPPSQLFWAWLTTAAFALAGIAMLIDRQARLAMRLMALMIALFGVLVWVPRIVAAPATLSNWNEIASNYLMGAASWLIAYLRSI